MQSRPRIGWDRQFEEWWYNDTHFTVAVETCHGQTDPKKEYSGIISDEACPAELFITEKTYTELNKSYKNTILSQTDVIKLYELYYATAAIKEYFDKNDINLNENPTMYNSQLTTLDKVIECLQHFHKKSIKSAITDVDATTDNLDTKCYRKDHIEKYINEIKHYDYPVTQRIPKKAKAT